MPNHVTNKIVFSAAKSNEVFAAVCPDGKFDFKTLIPEPLNMYRGNFSPEDIQDFPINWLDWRRQNWGTKWNAYAQSCGLEEREAFIKFDTASEVPYPVLAAFANKFCIPFQHRYFTEGINSWGVEEWGVSAFCPHIHRVKKDLNNPNSKHQLCLELKGYDPEQMK